MRVPGTWRLSAGGIPVPPVPFGTERAAEITTIRANMPEQARQQPRYVVDNDALWTAYFERRRAEQLASTYGAPALGGTLVQNRA